MDEFDDDGPDDSLEIAHRTYNRTMETVKKAGYREGLELGSDQVLQRDFDEGYEDGYEIAFVLGHYKGLANFLFKDVDHPQEITNILENTRRGTCYICTLESEGKITHDDDGKVLNDHRKHTFEICKKLQSYFEPLLKARGIETNVMKNLNLN